MTLQSVHKCSQSRRSRWWTVALLVSCFLLQAHTVVACNMMDDYTGSHCCCDELQNALLGTVDIKADGCCQTSAELAFMTSSVADTEPLNDHLQVPADWEPPVMAAASVPITPDVAVDGNRFLRRSATSYLYSSSVYALTQRYRI